MKNLRFPVGPSALRRLRWCVAIGLAGLLSVFLGTPLSVASPSQGLVPQRVSADRLSDVSADSPTDAWAVGQDVAGSTSMAKHWDGTAWTDVPLKLPGSVFNELVAVKALSPTDVWVVGWYSNQDLYGYRTLIEHWDGTQFSIVPSPRRVGRLLAVDATGPNDVWAVGGTARNYTHGSLVEHWDGSSWQLGVTTHLHGLLFTVSTVAPDDVLVGGVDLSRWDGSTWKRIWRNPGGEGYIGWLTRVQAVATSHPWVVGQRYDPSMFAAQVQDGQFTAEQGSCSYSGFGDVQVFADNDVWLVGGCYVDDESGTVHAQILHWNGVKWTRIHNAPHGALQGLDATSPSDIWAVGFHDNAKYSSLIEHYDGSSWTVVPS